MSKSKAMDILAIAFTVNAIGYVLLRFYLVFWDPLLYVPLELDFSFIGCIVFVSVTRRYRIKLESNNV